MCSVKTSLKVLPYAIESDCNTCSLQSCRIPSEIFYSIDHPFFQEPLVAKCTESVSKKQFICKLYPLYNKYPTNYCYLDESVCLINNLNQQWSMINTIDEAKNITLIEVLKVPKEPAKKVTVIVTINENALLEFQTNPITFRSILQTNLQSYQLIENALITFDVSSRISKMGISEVLIRNSSLSPSAFVIDSKTEIEIEDFKYTVTNCRQEEWMRKTDIEDLQEIESKLDKIIHDCKFLQDQEQQYFKPSLMTLIVGLCGTGKTSLCHNFLLRNSCNIFQIIPVNIIGQYPGETEEKLRRIFQRAMAFVKIFKPKNMTVIFIENIELLCSSSAKNSDNNGSLGHLARIESQFISLIDLLHRSNLEILVIGTTSNIELIGSALRRPGRFESEISIPLLTETGRKNILFKFLKKFFDNNQEISENQVENLSIMLAQQTAGFIGADMKLLLKNFNREILKETIKQNCISNMPLNDVKEKFEKCLKMIKPSSILGTDVTCLKCDEKLNNIGGMEELKKTLKISILTALKYPEKYEKFGLELPKGILLYGPPGCAKTTIAKCIANEAQMTFISTSGAEVYSPYVGKAEKFITKIFDTARKNSPCIIFLDEIDTLVGNRSTNSTSSSGEVQKRILSTLLTEMDGIGLRLSNFTMKNSNEKIQILIIAATNRPDLIDNALMRPGRFDKLIHVPAPNYKSRLGIFEIYTKQIPLHENIDLFELARKTENFSGADICNLCNEAAIQALTVHSDYEFVTQEDFNDVMAKFKPSLNEKQIQWYYDFEKRYIG